MLHVILTSIKGEVASHFNDRAPVVTTRRRPELGKGACLTYAHALPAVAASRSTHASAASLIIMMIFIKLNATGEARGRVAKTRRDYETVDLQMRRDRLLKITDTGCQRRAPDATNVDK